MISNSATQGFGGRAPGFALVPRPEQKAPARLEFLSHLCVALALVQFALAIGLCVALIPPPAWLDRVASQVYSEPEGFAVCFVAGVCRP